VLPLKKACLLIIQILLLENGIIKIEKRFCITVPEAAAMLGLSRNFAYELARRGEIPVIRFGKRLLIPRIALGKMPITYR
jgi:excisionase family DNA binding protein